MYENIVLYAVYFVIALVVICSLFICFKKQNTSSFAFCGSMTTLLVIVLLSTLPVCNEITSPGLSIEPRISQIEHKQQELLKIVSALAEIQAIAYNSSFTDGGSQENRKQLEESIESLKIYLTPEAKAQLEKGFNVK